MNLEPLPEVAELQRRLSASRRPLAEIAKAANVSTRLLQRIRSGEKQGLGLANYFAIKRALSMRRKA
jgi:hypothetical protein